MTSFSTNYNNINIYSFTSLPSKLNNGNIYLSTDCNTNCKEEMLTNYGRNMWLWIGQHLDSIDCDLCWTPEMKFAIYKELTRTKLLGKMYLQNISK